MISREYVTLTGFREIAGDAASGNRTTALRWVKNYDLRGWGSGSGKRTASRQVRLRMSETKGHQQIWAPSVVLDVTVAIGTGGNTIANVKSTAPRLRRSSDPAGCVSGTLQGRCQGRSYAAQPAMRRRAFFWLILMGAGTA